MDASIDTRSWNLVAGVILVAAGCGTSPTGADTSSAGTSTTNSASTSSSAGSSDTSATGPECNSDADCPDGFFCDGGMCEYAGGVDGSSFYECFDASECEPAELCVNQYCEGLDTPGSCGPAQQILQIPLPDDDQAWELSFVDLDDDGAEELVAVSSTKLHIYANGAPAPLTLDRGPVAPEVQGVVGGHFDDMPGEDLAILGDAAIWLHPSDGLGGLGPASELVSPIVPGRDLLAGDLDGSAPDDLLIWGQTGAVVRQLAGDELALGDDSYKAATLREFDSPSPGLALMRSAGFDALALDGAPRISVATLGDHAQNTLATIVAGGELFDVSTSVVSEWTYVQAWTPATNNPAGDWAILGVIEDMLPADLDNDGHSELVLVVAGQLFLQRNLMPGAGCLEPIMFNTMRSIYDLAIGDHDGDGDDDVALLFSGALLAIFDG